MKVFGKYEALEELESSAYVSTFRGRDRMLHRDAVIKVFYVDALTSAARQRFIREVRATVNLTHPNIVSVYDLGEQDEFAYIAFEQLDGDDLRHCLNRQAGLSIEAKVQFMIEVCEGLAFAHNSGVVHRDLKPENIFVVKSGRPRILDFAIARAFTSKSLPADFALITPEYMAPEQFRNQRGDVRTDIFSASLVFFELLTNRHPFPGADIAREIQSEPAPLITDIIPMLPARLATLIARGLSKDPSDRIQTAAEYAAELKGIASNAEDSAVSTKTSGRGLPTIEDKISELDFATKMGDVRDILAIMDEINRHRKEWFGESPLNEAGLERVDAAGRRALEAVVEISQSRIYSAITRGDVAAAQAEFKIIEQVCSRDSRYVELAGQINEQIQNLANRQEHQERGDISPKLATGDLRPDSGRTCPVCGESNPTDAVLCNSCGSRLPGSRRLISTTERDARRRSRVVVRPKAAKADVARKRSSYTLIAAAAAVVLVLVIVALVFRPTPSKGPVDIPVIGAALVANDAELRITPDATDKMKTLAKGESVQLLGKLPDMKPEAWAEVRLKSDGSRGFLRNSDLESVNTDNCAFDLWHAALSIPGIHALETSEKTDRVSQIEAVMGRCPADVTDELRMMMAETHTREAAALPWKMAQADITAAKSYLKAIQNQNEYSDRTAAVNVTLDGLAPEPAVTSPAPVTVENTVAAEKLLAQGKIDLEIAETRSQLNEVIANMTTILKMKFTERRGLEIQAEAKKVRDKAANSLVLAK